MDIIDEYGKLIDRARKEQLKLFEMKENLSMFVFLEKLKIKVLMKEYNKAIYCNLLRLDEVITTEYKFIKKYKTFNAKNH